MATAADALASRPPLSDALPLHDYQRRAVKHLHENPRAGLFLPMGAGKTLSTLATLTPEHLPVLVIAPKRVAQHTWPAEVRKWRPDLSVSVAVGSAKERHTAISAGADLTMVTRDNLGDFTKVRHPQYRTVVIDELSSFKARQSQRWRLARKLTQTAEHVWGLTGTPAGNGLTDLWAQVYLLDGGQRLDTAITRFRNRYFNPGRRLPNGVITSWDLKPGAEQAIYRAIEDICLHIPIEGLDLPPVTYNTVPTPLPESVKGMYESMKRDMVLDLDLLGADAISAGTAAALSSKLCQISAGAVYGDLGASEGYTPLHSEKTDALADIVETNGSPVLVFYRFRFEREAILSRFPDARTVDEPGVLDDWNAGRVPVLVAHPASAGHGLNLQSGGSTIVWTSIPFSLEEWEQANARLARQGQRNPVIVHILSAPGTLDAHIAAALRDKARVQDALLTYLTEDEALLG